jgi:uncharacterized repeat protein (TIGR01451 family)
VISCGSRAAKRRLIGRGFAAGLAMSIASVVVTSAAAAVTPTKDALAVAQAIADHPAFVSGAAFEAAPPSGGSAAVSTEPLAGFWTSHETTDFAILSTGDITAETGAPEPGQLALASHDLGGGPIHGGDERDVTTLRIDVEVPEGATCLQLDFRFLTEESSRGEPPARFDDAFIAQLDTPGWTTKSGKIVAENNFARVAPGVPISVLNSGPFMTALNAQGTIFDRAGPIRQAWAAVKPGKHSLYLSIFDGVDNDRDSAVFLDHLAFGSDKEVFCAPTPTLVTHVLADAKQSVAGSTNGYRIFVEAVGGNIETPESPPNLPFDAGDVGSIMSFLSPGFEYQRGSTTGAKTAEPSVLSDGELNWREPFKKTGEDVLELHFAVTVPEKPGVYPTSARAEGNGYLTLPYGPGAPIEVVSASVDLVVKHRQTPSPAVLGQKVSVEFTATNRGPQEATNVVLEAVLPATLLSTAISTTQGSCQITEKLVCKLGTLPVGGTASVTVVGVLESADGLAFSANAHALEPDSDLTNNSLSVKSAVVAAVDQAEPVVGETVETKAKSGKVKVRLPDTKTFVAIDDATEVPVGTVIDARKGEVKITSALDETGTRQTASFAGAKFVVRQKATGLTTIQLVGGNFAKCLPPRKQAERTTQRFIKDGARGRRIVRRAWGRGKGKFRTRGRYASATVRGTVWRTVDRCDGTMIRVKRGVVVVRDVNRKRAVAVKAGQRYLVKKPRGSAKSG